MDIALTARLRKTFGLLQAYADRTHRDSDCPYHHLLRNLRETARRSASFAEFLLDLARVDIRGADVLDCGCGMGDNAVIYAAMGAGSVTGIDIDLQRLSLLADAIARADADQRIVLRHEDAREMSFPDNTFDLAISIEAISHVVQRERMYKEVHRILRPGGVYIISDFNNARNPRIRRRMHAEWAALERKGGRIREARRKYIANLQPGLAESDLDLLADNTSLLPAERVRSTVSEYAGTGQLVHPSPYRAGCCPLNPDMVFLPHENLIDPLDETRRLQGAGFDVRSYGYIVGGRLDAFRWLNRLFNLLPVNTVKYALARAVQFVCRKPGPAQVPNQRNQ